MSPEVENLLRRILEMLNYVPRLHNKRAGFDSYDLAAEIAQILKGTP